MSIGKLTDMGVSGRSLHLKWDDGWSGVVDIAPLVEGHDQLAQLGDATLLARGRLSEDGWSVEWAEADIDFGAPQLRRWAEEQAGEIMPARAFRAWIERHRFTLDDAARALGLSRRTIAYYRSGEQPVPKTVMLATEGYDARRAA